MILCACNNKKGQVLKPDLFVIQEFKCYHLIYKTTEVINYLLSIQVQPAMIREVATTGLIL